MNLSLLKKVFSTYEGIFWGLIVICLMLIVIFSKFIITHPVDVGNRAKILSPPDNENIVGTDRLGRDVFSRTIVGVKASLIIGFTARIIALIIGTVLGIVSAYLGGIVDNIISRIVDAILAFPSLLLAIAISISIGPGYTTIIISLFLTSWAPITRLIRSTALSFVNLPFIEAAKSYGASHFRIIFYHLLPNCTSTIIVAFTSGIATTIMSESSLTFLGLGPDPSTPTLGQMIYSGMRDLNAPWVVLFPSIFLTLMIMSFNILGDILRDALDPREN